LLFVFVAVVINVVVAVPILNVALATVALRRFCKLAALRVISEATNRGNNFNNNNNYKSCNAATAEEVAKK